MKFIARTLGVSIIILLSACVSTPPNPALGTWAIALESPSGEIPGSFNLADGTGSALIELPVGAGGQTSTTLEDIKYDGGNVSFSANFDIAGNPTAFRFSGTVEGDSINGKVNSVLGTMAVKGTRK